MALKDPKSRFTETVANYDAYRPSYPKELIDWILKTADARPGAEIVDVGCGTGISSRLFAERGLRVSGVEPNDKMREAAAARAGGPRYVNGEAGATGLPPASADLVIAAQAFHWFDVPAALAEFTRILKPSGWCAAFWNDRTQDTEFLRGYECLLVRYSSEYKQLRGKGSTLKELRASPLVRDWTEAEFPNAQAMDRAGFLGRVHSSSYVAHGIADRAGFDAEIGALFERHAKSGMVEFTYQALGACWRL
ncbi:MAG: methyltransferase domain-containing protein [Elusimicrobia bacterium]|nr:methyltransferase domain-containing protein [Elusimicrobiota bacterium]